MGACNRLRQEGEGGISEMQQAAQALRHGGLHVARSLGGREMGRSDHDTTPGQ